MISPYDNDLAVPLGSLRLAVTTLRLGLVDHRVIEADQWDHAVTTVARSHFQLDGPARRHVYAMFRAARWGAADALEDAIAELEADLALPQSVPVVGHQLTLFDGASEER